MKLINEEKLVKKAMEYDENAILTLFSYYQKYLYRIAYMYYKNEQDALDAVSECVTKVYIALPKLKNPEFFKTWMTRILINEVLDSLKRSKRIISYEKLAESGIPVEIYEEQLSLEEKIDLYNALDKLKPDYRKALILKYFQDFSISEIAQIMELSESSIKVLLHRGRKKLRYILMEENKNE